MESFQLLKAAAVPNFFKHKVQEPVPDKLRSSDDITMHITIDSENISALRRVAMTCGEALSSIRVQPIPKSKRINVWLCINASALDKLMDAIMRTLSCAQFGQFKKYRHAVFGADHDSRPFNRRYSFMEEASWPEA